MRKSTMLNSGGRYRRVTLGERRTDMDSEQSTDKRVQFDFDVTFSNGGGIQGQGFRLDIDGDDIDDAALADYIVRDLRLLMVDSVRISNQEIIAEPHKRSGVATVGDASTG